MWRDAKEHLPHLSLRYPVGVARLVLVVLHASTAEVFGIGSMPIGGDCRR
jgi:hypothetical protein